MMNISIFGYSMKLRSASADHPLSLLLCLLLLLLLLVLRRPVNRDGFGDQRPGT